MASIERRRSARGFTLIEVMVSLVIVTLGMTAVYTQLSQYASNAIYLRDKTLASWIGSNTVTELSIQPSWPELGDEEIEVPFADRLWTVTIEIAETEVDSLRRADVSVALSEEPERILHTVSSLIEPPVPQGFPPVSWINVSQEPTG